MGKSALHKQGPKLWMSTMDTGKGIPESHTNASTQDKILFEVYNGSEGKHTGMSQVQLKTSCWTSTVCLILYKAQGLSQWLSQGTSMKTQMPAAQF